MFNSRIKMTIKNLYGGRRKLPFEELKSGQPP